MEQFNRESEEKRLEQLYLGKTVEIYNEHYAWVVGKVERLAVETVKGETRVIFFIGTKIYSIFYNDLEDAVTLLQYEQQDAG